MSYYNVNRMQDWMAIPTRETKRVNAIAQEKLDLKIKKNNNM